MPCQCATHNNIFHSLRITELHVIGSYQTIIIELFPMNTCKIASKTQHIDLQFLLDLKFQIYEFKNIYNVVKVIGII